MKYIDINRKFTETVSSYIAQGYIINTASMSGSQGEIAHIDLTDGKQIVAFCWTASPNGKITTSWKV